MKMYNSSTAPCSGSSTPITRSFSLSTKTDSRSPSASVRVRLRPVKTWAAGTTTPTEFDPHGTFHGFIPGHSFGQYLSGLSRAPSGDGLPAHAKRRSTVWFAAFAPTVTSKFYDGYHLPAYTFDKTNCGLIDAHQFAGCPMAFDVLNAATDAVLPHLPRKAMARSEQYREPHPDEAYCWDETYTLPENFFLAYQRGAGDRYRELAIRFLEDDLYFDPLAEGQNVLPGEHAYSHVNAFSSAMQAYAGSRQRKASPRRAKRIRVRARHAELCHRRLGARRSRSADPAAEKWARA